MEPSPNSTTQPIQFDIMSAMCDGNRGIGIQDRLPWPFLSRDYQYYSKMISSVSTPGKKAINIRGRYTWLCAKDPERSHPNVLHIIVSNTLGEIDHPNVYKVVPTFDAAVELVNRSPLREQTDCVWVCGGNRIYAAGLNHPLCRHIYLTRVYQDFPADVFFPEFENEFEEIREIDHPNVYKVVPTFDAAVELVNRSPLREQTDCVWVCGGNRIYAAGLNHPLCRHIYLTRVYQDFPADVFFPEFENEFEEISLTNVDGSLMEENGIHFQFKVYKRSMKP